MLKTLYFTETVKPINLREKIQNRSQHINTLHFYILIINYMKDELRNLLYINLIETNEILDHKFNQGNKKGIH